MGVNWPYGCVVSWVDTGVAGFTKKSGVFFAYGVDGPEFFPALYVSTTEDAVTRSSSFTQYNLNAILADLQLQRKMRHF